MKSKYNVILIHGYEGNSENHWFPYIKENLEKHGVEVLAPEMPTEYTVEAWLEKIKEISEKVGEHTILIGHSLGCPAILHLITNLSKPVFGTVFVAPFGKAYSVEQADQKEEEECNRFVQSITWKQARKNAGNIKIFAGLDDDLVPLEVSIHFASMLQQPIRLIENAGHFCADDGFETFPELLEYLLTQIYMTYEEFKKLDARVGHIKKVEEVEGADKLLRFEIDFGEGQDRQIVSGIREYFPEYEQLVGKKALYVLNLAPREIKGVTSYGMLMAVDGIDGKPVFLIPEQEVNPGSKVR
jgi:methionine--tRNA ligase beta chain